MTGERKVYRVAELNHLSKQVLEDEIGSVWLEGEISNFKHHYSGHMYFSLKDEKAAIQAVLFRGSQQGLKVEMADGIKVQAFGQVTLFEPQGKYQMVCRQVEPAGKGSLQEAFEKLKKKLEAEGLFDPERKKPLPVLPRHIGLVTSATGAAIRDILNVIDRRFPNVHVVVAPARVQGEGAAEEIAAAIAHLNRLGGIDVMIVGRGGGSLEDLWAFNEEVVARAVAASDIPIISAVGHEIDFTICDFVADLRAETPSAAAEIIVGPKEAFEQTLRQFVRRMEREAVHQLQRRAQRVDDLLNRVLRLAERETAARRRQVRELENRLAGLSPQARLKRHTQQVERIRGRLLACMQRTLAAEKQRLGALAASLTAMNPTGVLQRGYSITRNEKGEVVQHIEQAPAGQPLETLLATGKVFSTVTRTESGESHDGKESR
jgi:exodeoxyribonuclease VII large subunit